MARELDGHDYHNDEARTDQVERTLSPDAALLD